MTEKEFEELANLTEEFETVDEFLNSGFIEKYYNDRDADGINYIPTHDDEVTQCGVTAHYGCYYIYYTYKDKPMAVCVDMLSGKYNSAEDIYNETIERLSGNDDALSHCKYEKDADMVIYDEKTDTIPGYISVRNNIGFRVEIVTYDTEASVDDIIEFARHLTF